MSSVTCGINMFLLVVIVVLIIVFTNDIFKSIPVLKKLFTDPTNYCLLITLVILIILIDLPSGIVIAFLVLYLSMYMNLNKSFKKDNFANIDTNTNTNTKYNTSYNNIRSESEFVYNNTKPFPNLNIKPFHPISQEEINKVQVIPAGCSSKQSGVAVNDFITSVGLPNRDGYDITGCRYDFKTSPQNLTKYGPPLAGCAAYSGEQAKICGTVFYPLHG